MGSHRPIAPSFSRLLVPSVPRLLALLLCVAPGVALAQGVAQLDSAFLAGFRWRNIGPANMSGRIVDIEGVPGTRTIYVAAATGGLWKSLNAGTTFQQIFPGPDDRVASLGDIAIAPSDPNVLYLGTGEPNSRNSISPGAGVYKSTDAGKTWAYVGLKETEAIGRIVVHPTDPNTAWVAALGAIWRSNPERGLYKTSDGGGTWRNVKFISDQAGVVDVEYHHATPNVLWATSWERVRGPYFLRSGGPGSAVWKSSDGGESWTEVTGGGLPESMKGRMEVAIAHSNPRVMYMMIEADTMPNPRPAAGAERQVRPSGLYRSEDGGVTWTQQNNRNVRPFYYSQVRVDTEDPDRVYFSSTPHAFSTDGGKTVRSFSQGLHVDTHAHWIDPTDGSYMVVGNDGGIGVSFDRGGNWIFPNTFPVGQFYNVSHDFAVPYNVCGGLQDNGSWCGPSRKRGDPITNADWINVSGGDGFGTAQDPTNPNIIYSTSQAGNTGRLDLSTGVRIGLRGGAPSWQPIYRRWMDSIEVIRGDTTRPETSAQRRQIQELRRRATQDSLDLQFRWNWNTPYFISPHNTKTLYFGANRVMKSVKMGEEMYPVSPDLTTRDTMKIRISTSATGGITPDNTGAETHATIVSLAESPVRPGLLYAGTDDGKVWVTRNDGAHWEDLTGRFPGVPAGTYVSRIEPSHHDSARVYFAFDNHRNGDFTPYVYASNDFGRGNRPLANDLPTGAPDFVHVIREDPRNQNLLFVGTDVGVYVSANRGGNWHRFMRDLPAVPVHDLKIHPRDQDLIAGTHGRSIWIADIAPLEQLDGRAMTAQVHLFEPKVAWQLNAWPDGIMGGGGGSGHQFFRSNSPPHAAEIVYRVASGARGGPARIVITNAAGDTIRSQTGPGAPGLHRVYWAFQAPPPPRQRPETFERDSTRLAARLARAVDSMVTAGGNRGTLDSARTQLLSGQIGGGGGGGGFGGGGGGSGGLPEFEERPGEGNVLGQGGGGGGNLAEPGEYLLTVTVGGQSLRSKLRVQRAPPNPGWIQP